jgi:hypothetical protein
MGRYNLIFGIAWCIELPVDYQLQTSLNSLEFLACVINIWVDFFHDTIEQESCLLSQTDSSSAMGWLQKSNFSKRLDENLKLSIARKPAKLLIKSELVQPMGPRRLQLHIRLSLQRLSHLIS